MGCRRKALLEALLVAFLGNGIWRSPHYRRLCFFSNLQFSPLNKCKLQCRLTVALRFQQFIPEQQMYRYEDHWLAAYVFGDRVVQTATRQLSDATARTTVDVYATNSGNGSLYRNCTNSLHSLGQPWSSHINARIITSHKPLSLSITSFSVYRKEWFISPTIQTQ